MFRFKSRQGTAMRLIIKTLLLSLTLITRITLATPYHYELHAPDGTLYNEKSFPEQYQLIAFGFTTCPDVCPTTLYDFKRVLEEPDLQTKIQAIFITIDPERDTPERLKAYTAHFHPKILALRGNEQATKESAQNFRAQYGYQHQDENNPQNYTVYHSTYIYLLDKNGTLIDLFDYQSGATQLIEGIRQALKEDQS